MYSRKGGTRIEGLFANERDVVVEYHVAEGLALVKGG